MKRQRLRVLLAVLAPLTFCAAPAGAQDDFDDAAALQLADTAPEAVEAARPWRGFLEAGLGETRSRNPDRRHFDRRLSLDLRYDGELAPGWRAVLSSRLDVTRPAQSGDDHAINTLREAYLSRRLADDLLIDFGRVNPRQGVALGWNPTDWFKTAAVRSLVSIDPASLRENRQGSVLLRGQKLWASGSLTALYSPQLKRHDSLDGFSLGLGATNARDRGLIALSQHIAKNFDPQFLLYREAGRPLQLGFNLATLVNDATVAHLEWSGGRARPNLADSLRLDARRAWRNRLAAGLTYTTDFKLSLSAEYQYDGGAPDRRQWRALRRDLLPLYAAYRLNAFRRQDQVTREAIFLHARWQDALIHRLDLSAMLTIDRIDASRRGWLEARYRGEDIDYILQWQQSRGHFLSNFGTLPEKTRWQAALRLYF